MGDERSTEEAMLTSIVLKALSLVDDGWAAVDPGRVVVKELSKGGAKRGARIFKFEAFAEGDIKPSPPVVALHYGPAINSQHLIMRKTAKATELFSQAGLSPPRLATGENWYIEEWWDHDENQEWTKSPEKFAEWGRLTAKMHAIPIDWFLPFQAEALTLYPWLAEVPFASIGGRIAWMHCTSPNQAVEKEGLRLLMEDKQFASGFCDFGPFQPRHAAASKIVTTHHDYHTLNLIHRSDSGLRIVDLEVVGINLAIHDITSCLSCAEWDTAKSRAFLEGYLEGSGRAATETDVAALLLDAHVFAAFSVRIWLRPPGFLNMTSDEAKARLEKWNAYGELVRESEIEQVRLLEAGPQASFTRAGLL